MMRTVKVCINGMTENEQIRGPVRYIYEIVANMPHDNYEVVLIAGSWQKDIYRDLESKVSVHYYDINRSKVGRALFFMLYMPWVLNRLRVDVYHIPDTNPLPIMRFGAKIISTIHDCAEYVVPHRFSRFQSLYRRIISAIQAKYSDLIITVSKSSMRDICKYLPVDESKVRVIYNGITSFENNARQVKESGSEGYILYVGVLEKEKNVDKLLLAYAALPRALRDGLKVYLVGRKGNDYENIQSVINSHGLQDDVCIHGYVSDNELDGLYRSATVFAYLSEYEGFGLPILEAMQYGIPVLTTNKSSLNEIAGDAALKTDTSVEAIAKSLSRLLSSDELREKYVALGLEKCKKFTWIKAAEETATLYEQMV